MQVKTSQEISEELTMANKNDIEDHRNYEWIALDELRRYLLAKAIGQSYRSKYIEFVNDLMDELMENVE